MSDESCAKKALKCESLREAANGNQHIANVFVVDAKRKIILLSSIALAVKNTLNAYLIKIAKAAIVLRIRLGA
ncbi:CLUMA_CG012308, isoform A [Clunio marinus]|uniref:CLUMA_CG012308, isoform A n=1 Tax=Clunio marinus TaxID=568069 RepID=A0A1J1IEU7_9DIPT|nr:CLUMA_CG012308, isoform A [Clunio marinus]